jgi:cobalt-precorrin 5A hydrolase
VKQDDRRFQPGASIDEGNAHARSIIAVTAHGAVAALRLARAMGDSKVYLPERFAGAVRNFAAAEAQSGPKPATGAVANWEVVPYSGRVAPLVAEAFARSREIVLVMAVGAAVRLIAALVGDKRTDPAVVVVDDKTRFAISLLSGHLGGANRLAGQLAAVLGAQAVITTASEGAGAPAADLIGAELGWQSEPASNLKGVAAALVNGELVGFYQDAGSEGWPAEQQPPHLVRFPTIAALIAAEPAAAILISDRIHDLPAGLAERTATYRPPVLILGIGCSRGAEEGEIAATVERALHEAALSPLSVCAIATIDRKADEPGLWSFSRRNGWPIITFGAAELNSAAGDWHRSAIVLRAVGAAGVAEPAALMGAGTATLVLEKRTSAHVTVAVARTLTERTGARQAPWDEEPHG